MEPNLVVDLLHKFLQVLPQFRETTVAAAVDLFSLQCFQGLAARLMLKQAPQLSSRFT
jgi:hypothetical protein